MRIMIGSGSRTRHGLEAQAIPTERSFSLAWLNILNQIAKPVPISANCKLEELVKWIKQEK